MLKAYVDNKFVKIDESVRITTTKSKGAPAIAEFGVYAAYKRFPLK